MIVGIGIDSVEIERVRKACESEAFLSRCFTEEELRYMRSSTKRRFVETAAGNWAVKEAVSKSFGTGFRTMALADITVLRDTLGKPYVTLEGEGKRLMQQLEIDTIHVTITNTQTEATAFVVAEKSNRKEQ